MKLISILEHCKEFIAKDITTVRTFNLELPIFWAVYSIRLLRHVKVFIVITSNLEIKAYIANAYLS